MTHKIKALGLAFVAIAALGAVAASAAQAGSLDVGATPSVVTGTQVTGGHHTLSFVPTGQTTAENVSCTTATLEGTLQGQQDVKEGTLTATYSGCTAFFGLAKAEVVMNGCKYTVTGESNASNPALTAWADVTGCTTGKKIEVRVPSIGCTLTLGEQNTLSHLVFTNEGNGTTADVKANATVSGVAFTTDGAGCPGGNAHNGTSAGFSGTTTVKAFQDTGTKQVQDTMVTGGHQYTEHLCGTQVSLVAT